MTSDLSSKLVGADFNIIAVVVHKAGRNAPEEESIEDFLTMRRFSASTIYQYAGFVLP